MKLSKKVIITIFVVGLTVQEIHKKIYSLQLSFAARFRFSVIAGPPGRRATYDVPINYSNR